MVKAEGTNEYVVGVGLDVEGFTERLGNELGEVNLTNARELEETVDGTGFQYKVEVNEG